MTHTHTNKSCHTCHTWAHPTSYLYATHPHILHGKAHYNCSYVSTHNIGPLNEPYTYEWVMSHMSHMSTHNSIPLCDSSSYLTRQGSLQLFICEHTQHQPSTWPIHIRMSHVTHVTHEHTQHHTSTRLIHIPNAARFITMVRTCDMNHSCAWDDSYTTHSHTLHGKVYISAILYNTWIIYVS